MTLEELSDFIKIPYNAVRGYASGESKPKKARYEHLLNVFDVDHIIFANPYKKYSPITHPVVAIDLDGTIWKDSYPKMSVPFANAIKTINRMVDTGYEVIIWTARGGRDLEKCKKYLRDLGLNKNITFNHHAKYFTDKFPIQSPKIGASIYLDDKGYNAPDFSKHWYVIEKEFI